ncbi:hypothetical protein JZ751_004825, partial [Albula glossodonta]
MIRRQAESHWRPNPVSFCSFCPFAVRLVMLFRQARTPARCRRDPAASFISSSSLSGGFCVRLFFRGSESLDKRNLAFAVQCCRLLCWACWAGSRGGSFLPRPRPSSSVLLGV